MKSGVPLEKLQREFSLRTKLIYELSRKKVWGYEEVGKIINDYYKNPVGVLSKYNIEG